MKLKPSTAVDQTEAKTKGTESDEVSIAINHIFMNEYMNLTAVSFSPDDIGAGAVNLNTSA